MDMVKVRRIALVVDDSQNEREAYRHYLLEDVKYIYQIWEEQSGKNCLELSKQFQPDVIVLDLCLAKENGLSFLAKLKQQKQKSQIIVIVSPTEEYIAAQAMKSGAVDYLLKGEINQESFLASVHQAIATLEQQQEWERNSQWLNLGLEVANICTWEWNILTDEIYVSQNFRDLFGIDSGSFASTIEAWLKIVHPLDREFVKNAIARTRINHREECREYRLIINGKVKWICSQGKTYLDQAGNPVRILGTIRDITESKISQEDLQRSQDFIQQIANTTPGILYLFDLAEKRNLYVNNQVFQTLGYVPEAVTAIGNDFFERIMHPEDRLRISSHWQKFNRKPTEQEDFEQQDFEQQDSQPEDKILSFEYRMLHANGEWRWFRSRDRVFKYDESGYPLQIIGTAQDITDYKYTEAALQRSHEQFQLMATAVNCMVYDWEIERRTVERSQGLIRTLGYEPREVSTSPEWWSSIIHPDDRSVVEQQFQTFITGSNNNYSLEYRLCYKHEPGCLWVQDMGFVVRDETNRPVRVVGIAIDVSDRKQAEINLTKIQQRFELAQKAGNIGIFDWDIQTGEVTWNEEEEIIFGLPLGEFGGHFQDWQVLVDPQDLPQIEQSLQDAIANQETDWIGEYRIIKADTGEVRWVEARGKFFYNQQNQPLRMIGTNIDITQQKRSQESLQQSEMRFRRLIESNIIGCIVSDFDGNIKEANDAFLELVNYQREDLITGKMRWNEMTPPEYSHLDQKAIAQAREFGACTPFEKEYIRKDGKRVPILIGFALLEGSNDNVICFIVDLSDRKQIEEALRKSQGHLNAFVEANVIGILFGDVDGNIYKANDEFLRIIGYERQDLESGNISWIEITPPEYLYLDEQRIAETKITGACSPYEKEYIRKDGTRVPVLVGFTLVGESKNESVAFILDLTKGKQLEATLRESQERYRELAIKEQAARAQAETANRAKDNFVAMVSHDLRAPLNSILGWSKLLRSGKLDQNAANRALEIIERNAKSQSRLIGDLLDISRIIQGKLQLTLAPISLVSVIQVTIEQVSLAAADKQIMIETNINAVFDMVSGDFHRLQQVLGNLLSNAIKFTPNGGKIDVCLETVDNQAQIHVIDTGKGISSEFLPHVFERFRQENTIAKTNEGLGLGLAIVRHLVELHSGTVKVESRGEGQGATFIISLPLIANQTQTAMTFSTANVNITNRHLFRKYQTQEHQIQEYSINHKQENRGNNLSIDLDNSQKPQEINSNQLLANKLLKDIKILVVDDEADSREVMRLILVQAGAEVSACDSVAKGIAAIQENKPDLVISDIAMPTEDGYSFIRKIRASENSQQIPAIAITAYTQERDRAHAIAAGFQLHLPKPIEPKQLITAIVDLLGI